MADILGTFFSTVAMAFSLGVGDNLAMAVPVTEAHPYFWPLHQAGANVRAPLLLTLTAAPRFPASP